MSTKRSGWHIDRRIPLAVVVMLMMQMAALVIWATQLEARVTGLEQAGGDMRRVAERLARLEERMEGLRTDATDIKRHLEKLTLREVRR